MSDVTKFSKKERTYDEVLDSFLKRRDDFDEIYLVAIEKDSKEPVLFLSGKVDNILITSGYLHAEWLKRVK